MAISEFLICIFMMTNEVITLKFAVDQLLSINFLLLLSFFLLSSLYFKKLFIMIIFRLWISVLFLLGVLKMCSLGIFWWIEVFNLNEIKLIISFRFLICLVLFKNFLSIQRYDMPCRYTIEIGYDNFSENLMICIHNYHLEFIFCLFVHNVNWESKFFYFCFYIINYQHLSAPSHTFTMLFVAQSVAINEVLCLSSLFKQFWAMIWNTDLCLSMTFVLIIKTF